MNQGKICVSVCGKTASEVLDKISLAASDAEVIEIRFDCLNAEEIAPLIENLDSITTPLLITLRPTEQGGYRDLTTDDRREFWDLVSSRLKRKNIFVDHEFD